MNPKDQETVNIAKCPACNAKRGDWCVFRRGIDTPHGGEWYGVLHASRRRQAYYIRKSLAERAKSSGRAVGSSEASLIRRAEVDWERKQRQQLAVWLMNYASILFDEP